MTASWFQCTCGGGKICAVCWFLAGVCITILVVAIIASRKGKKKKG